jgi:hypothetical protein
MLPLILKRASASRSSGQWRDDDHDVLEDSKVVGRIFRVPAAAPEVPPLDVGERPRRADQARGARLRGDTRGRDGSVRQELAEKLGAGMTARHRSLAGSGEAFEVWFDL